MNSRSWWSWTTWPSKNSKTTTSHVRTSRGQIWKVLVKSREIAALVIMRSFSVSTISWSSLNQFSLIMDDYFVITIRWSCKSSDFQKMNNGGFRVLINITSWKTNRLGKLKRNIMANCLSIRTVYKWYQNFRSGEMST